MSEASPMGVDPVDAVRQALRGPVRFASRDDYARLERLRGFEGLVQSVLTTHASVIVEPLREELKRLAAGFDDAPLTDRRRRIAALAAALDLENEATQKPEHSTALAANADPVGRGLETHATPPDEAVDVTPFVQGPPPPRRADLKSPRAGAPSVWDVLMSPVDTLAGVGPRRAETLRRRELGTLGALLHLLPRTYEDRRTVTPFRSLTAGSAHLVRGVVEAAGVVGRGRGARFEVVLAEPPVRLKLVFFRYRVGELERRFSIGELVTAYGDVAHYAGGMQMVHPLVANGDATTRMRRIQPVYPELTGVPGPELRRALDAAVQRIRADPPHDLLPRTIRERAQVCPLDEALLEVHAPPDTLDAAGLLTLVERRAAAHRRLAFEELFVLQLAMGLRQRHATRDAAVSLPGDDAATLMRTLLPFTPTGAQHRSLEEVLVDLERGEPMGRLLQGDVGAGKTAVAAAACLRAVRAGAQAAIMAPTEILAEQHHATFQRLFSPLGVRVELFTGGSKTKARRVKLARLKNGELQIAVGTHALLVPDVEFARLAFCVIDEQHRFGVVQRRTLKDKGPTEDGVTRAPHILVMTATPIPRSLALTVYGDLQVSVLDELPPGRQPIATRVVRQADRRDVLQELQDAVRHGARAYVVYPLIEESEKLDLEDATRGRAWLADAIGDDRVGLVHGRMSSEDRDAEMRRFSRGEIQVLVATTVIEVGVDVPAATLMVVMHAERFGLSQLHQLRGRVGRGVDASRCVLVVGEEGAGRDAYRRLQVMERTTDGFRIAEEDLAIRGPGDFLGTRQSGLPTLTFADLAKHRALVEEARVLAQEVLADDPSLTAPHHAGLHRLVFERYREKLSLAEAA